MTAPAKKLTPEELDLLRARARAIDRQIAAKRAAMNLIPFSRFMEPDPNAPEDVGQSLYSVQPHHNLLAQALEEAESGVMLAKGFRILALSLGPQKGKSQLSSRNFPAWAAGRNPKRNIMLGSYNDDFAREFGDDVRNIMALPQYAQVFPRVRLRRGGKAKDHMVTEAGGKLNFVGRGGSGTGKPADIFIIDDPIKNAEEAESLTIRNTVWNWFLKVADSRTHGQSVIIIVQTRWSEDDLIGRLTDKTSPHYPAKMAAMTMYINIPSIVEDEALAKALGVEKGGSIWEAKFPLWLLEMKRDADPRGFGALEMGRPTPPEGAFYKVQQIRQCWYRDIEQLPKSLRYYGSCDLAVSDDLQADHSVIGDWGLDEHDVLWLLPTIHWDKKKADASVDQLISMGKNRWMTLFGEKGQIDRAIRPFLEERMQEEGCYFSVETFANVNKGTASLSFRGRMNQRKVRFPVFAEWWQRAEEQMLKFTGSGDDKEDDFCDMLARIGQGLRLQVAGDRPGEEKSNVVPIAGTIAWAHRQWVHTKKLEKQKVARGSF